MPYRNADVEGPLCCSSDSRSRGSHQIPDGADASRDMSERCQIVEVQRGFARRPCTRSAVHRPRRDTVRKASRSAFVQAQPTARTTRASVSPRASTPPRGTARSVLCSCLTCKHEALAERVCSVASGPPGARRTSSKEFWPNPRKTTQRDAAAVSGVWPADAVWTTLSRARDPGNLRRRGWATSTRGATGQVLAEETMCWVYGEPGTPDDPLTLDHVIARALGGETTRANARAAHRSCNSRRGATVRGPGGRAIFGKKPPGTPVPPFGQNRSSRGVPLGTQGDTVD